MRVQERLLRGRLYQSDHAVLLFFQTMQVQGQVQQSSVQYSAATTRFRGLLGRSDLCQYGAFVDRPCLQTGNRGFGLRTNGPIIAGDFIIPYVGEIITFNESYRRVENEYKHRHDYYFLHYFDAEVVDAGMVGNEARFINHSCNPNVHVVRWSKSRCLSFRTND